MKIAGLQKVSLIEYPEHITAIVFTQGCNYNCSYCHNANLIPIDNDQEYLDLEKFWSFLESRKGLIDGVSITGGEPLLQSDIIKFIKKIKAQGFKVKLDTNGSRPVLLKELIVNKLIDYIAMDVKVSGTRYEEVTDCSNFKAVTTSIDLILEADLDYEFRTTVVPGLVTSADLKKIGSLIEGAKRHYIQNFRPVSTLDSQLEQRSPFTDKKLKEFKEVMEYYVEQVKIRN